MPQYLQSISRYVEHSAHSPLQSFSYILELLFGNSWALVPFHLKGTGVFTSGAKVFVGHCDAGSVTNPCLRGDALQRGRKRKGELNHRLTGGGRGNGRWKTSSSESWSLILNELSESQYEYFLGVKCVIIMLVVKQPI